MTMTVREDDRDYSAMSSQLLGEAHQYTVGDRRIVIGWRRSLSVLRGLDYHRPPTGYIRTETIGRRVAKGTTDLTVVQLRELAFHLTRYANALEHAQTEERDIASLIR